MGGELWLNGWDTHGLSGWAVMKNMLLFCLEIGSKKMLVSTIDHACTKQHPSTEPTEDTRVLTTINIT